MARIANVCVASHSGGSLGWNKVMHTHTHFICVSINKNFNLISAYPSFFPGDKYDMLMLSKYSAVTIIFDRKLKTQNKIL